MDSSPVTAQIAEAVRTAMADQGISQAGLAEATGIPRVTLIRRLNGQSSFTVSELHAVAAHLGLSVSTLMEAVA